MITEGARRAMIFALTNMWLNDRGLDPAKDMSMDVQAEMILSDLLRQQYIVVKDDLNEDEEDGNDD